MAACAPVPDAPAVGRAQRQPESGFVEVLPNDTWLHPAIPDKLWHPAGGSLRDPGRRYSCGNRSSFV